jgi:hypothetical protein
MHYDETICQWEQFRTFDKFVPSVIDSLRIVRKEYELFLMTGGFIFERIYWQGRLYHWGKLY